VRVSERAIAPSTRLPARTVTFKSDHHRFMSSPLPYRKIHLDYHTHPAVSGVGAKFDAQHFADQLVAAGVDGIVLFAKDHYGYSFYRSEVFPVHPHLVVDFLPLAVRACKDRGIHVEAYISVCLDNLTWRNHPDWACRNVAGKELRWGEPNVLLDLASPLIDEVAVPYTREVARIASVDGLWFDIVMYPDDGFYGEYFDRRLRAEGRDDSPSSRSRLARDLVLEAQRKLAQAAREERAELRIVINNQVLLGDTNSWPYNDVLEIESDPAVWPLHDMPLRCRFARSAGEGGDGVLARPHAALTTRFQRCWGDFGGLRSAQQLKWELGRIFAAGTKRVSIGDHLHPDGALEPAVYKLIGEAFAHCRQVAPLVEESKPLSEVALLIEPNHTPYSSAQRASCEAQLGAVNFLLGHATQFSVRVAQAKPTDGELLFLPGGEPLPQEVIQAIIAHVEAGHSLIAFGEHVLGLEALVSCAPAEETPLSGQYLLCENQLADERIGRMALGLNSIARVFTPGASTEVIAHCLPPLFDASLPNNYHPFGPVDREATPRPVIARRGRVLLCGANLPALLHREEAWAYRLVLSRLLGILLPAPLLQLEPNSTVSTLPAGIEISLHQGMGKLYIHLAAPPAAGLPSLHFRVDLQACRKLSSFTGATPRSLRRLDANSSKEIDWQVTGNFLEVAVVMHSPHEVLTVEF
jgi:hypothetical protein